MEITGIYGENGITRRNGETESFQILSPSSPFQLRNLQLRGTHSRNHVRFSPVRDLQSIASVRIDPSTFDKITGAILASAIEVHRILGPGLLESSYTPCLHYELTSRKLRFAVQRAIPIVYKGIPLDACYRIDLIVEDLVVVEIKSVAALAPVHQAQVLTYLRLTGCPVGLLINFNVPRLIDGVRRSLNPSARVKEG